MFRSARYPCKACDETSGSSADSLEPDMLDGQSPRTPQETCQTGILLQEISEQGTDSSLIIER